ncbi:MAG: hypothetical protein R3Y47_06635 [Lachnospiraceae bacterium]
MEHFDIQLQEIQDSIASNNRLISKQKTLQKQHDELKEHVAYLAKIKYHEDKDVEKLEKLSLATMLNKLSGKQQEKLEKEQAEAYAATVKYDMAVSELADIEDTIKRNNQTIRSTDGLQREFNSLFEQKADALKHSLSEDATKLLELEAQIHQKNLDLKEISEAILAGKNTLSTVASILESLTSAQNWGTFDLVGGGLISNVAKHDHLNSAQKKIESLNKQIRNFQTELADINFSTDIHVTIDGFLKYADYIFDGLFFDWMALSKISNSVSEVKQIQSKLDEVMKKLYTLEQTTNSSTSTLISERNSLIRSTPL